jgi:NAD(P)-dependent dehydrogenase (short-subunit alcohol dehydrogenase family)
MSVALITGGSAGLGRAFARSLAGAGWRVVVDGRDGARLADLAGLPDIVTVAGDVTDEWHRGALADAVEREGRLDLLVHNASTLGPTPLPPLGATTVQNFHDVWRTNLGAPLALTADLLALLVSAGGTLLSISSDAAVEHYPGWGLYGATKAGLDHLTLTFGEENPAIRAYAVDPGDMRTAMHQDAFPGEDISDRPLPETVVPRLLALLDARPESGRYRAAEFGGDVR